MEQAALGGAADFSHRRNIPMAASKDATLFPKPLNKIN